MLAQNNMFIIDYWKIDIVNFLEMENNVFFKSRELAERLYLLDIFELFIIFQDLGKVIFGAVVISN